MRALLIAEKPDLMRKIDECYKKHKKDIPYEITFASQRGHLLTLLMPDEMDESLSDWGWETLPIEPEMLGGWRYKVIQEKKDGKNLTAQERYDNIKKALDSGRFDIVINAGDPDREGELLIRETLLHMGNKLPCKRFWTNDLTDDAIKDALLNLRDDDNDPQLVNLYKSALGRQHSDYRFGMNLSRAGTKKMGGRVAIGRVMTMILYLVWLREQEILNFQSTTVYGVKIVYREGFEGFLYRKKEQEEKDQEEDDDAHGIVWFGRKEEALALINTIGNKARVLEHTATREKTRAPKLFKLATAQIEAGRLGYSAADTLRILQGLYEKKIMSYPRTDCEYLGGNEDLKAMLRAAAAVPELGKYVEQITDTDIQRVKGSTAWINAEALKDEGHSALVPTRKQPVWEDLDGEEQDIFRMICCRFLAPFLPPLIQDKTVLIAETGGSTFRSSGKTLVDPGWTVIYGKKFEDTGIPRHAGGDILQIQKREVTEKTTECPKRYSTADLVAVCENPAKFLTDKSYKALGKKLHIGTPATRASIIEELIVRDKYMERKKEGKREVVAPTKTGASIITNLKDCDICKVDLTASWEDRLEQVRRGTLPLEKLEEEMREHVRRLVEDIRTREMTELDFGDYKEIGKCPLCGKRLMRGPTRFYCTGYKNGCKTGGYREKYGAVITEKEFIMLLKGTSIKKKMTKDGLTWTQTVTCDRQTGMINYTGEYQRTRYRCPVCSKGILENAVSYTCRGKLDKTCGVTVPKSFSSKKIPLEQIEKLFRSGKTDVIEGFISKKGSQYAASLYIDKEARTVDRRFEEMRQETDFTCPVCEKPIVLSGSLYICSGECGFKMYGTRSKHMIPAATVRKMLEHVRMGQVGGGAGAYVTNEEQITRWNCPVCGREVTRNGMHFSCCAEGKGCGFEFYRICGGHILTDPQISELLEKGRTEVFDDFTGNSGGTFSARVVIDYEQRMTKLQFEETQTKSIYKCPICRRKAMIETAYKITCGCGFEAWKKQGGRMLSGKDLDLLFSKGETGYIKFVKKNTDSKGAGKKASTYQAKVVIDAANRSTKMVFKR